MSLTATREVRCTCGATVSVFCADSINAERHPHMRDAILERSLHVFRCEACLASLAVEKAFVYIDLDRKQLYSVQAPGSRAQAREHGEALVSVFDRALGEQAGGAARAAFGGGAFHVRVVYGTEELREKLVAHDAGVRDLPLEALKAELLAGTPALREAGVIALYLDRAEGDELVFIAERVGEGPPLLERGVTVPRARYEELAAVPWQELCARYPGIASGPHVSMLRWALPQPPAP